jgi:hypothetical protein
MFSGTSKALCVFLHPNKAEITPSDSNESNPTPQFKEEDIMHAWFGLWSRSVVNQQFAAMNKFWCFSHSNGCDSE